MINPFKKIDEKDKQKLLKNLEAVTFNFQKGKTILTTLKGENLIGIILEGAVQIIKTDYNGNSLVIEELEENDIIGTNISYLTDKECDIVTLEETKIIIVDYFRLLNENKNINTIYIQFIKNLLEITTNIITRKNERIEILTKKGIRNKLLEYFRINSKSKTVFLPFTFTELADYLAVDRSAMSREISNLKEEGFIQIKGKKITLLY